MIIVYCINEKRADSVDLFFEEHYWIQIITFIQAVSVGG